MKEKEMKENEERRRMKEKIDTINKHWLLMTSTNNKQKNHKKIKTNILLRMT